MRCHHCQAKETGQGPNLLTLCPQSCQSLFQRLLRAEQQQRTVSVLPKEMCAFLCEIFDFWFGPEFFSKRVIPKPYLHTWAMGDPSSCWFHADMSGRGDRSAGTQAGTQKRWTGQRCNQLLVQHRWQKAQGQGIPAAHMLK